MYSSCPNDLSASPCEKAASSITVSNKMQSSQKKHNALYPASHGTVVQLKYTSTWQIFFFFNRTSTFHGLNQMVDNAGARLETDMLGKGKENIFKLPVTRFYIRPKKLIMVKFQICCLYICFYICFYLLCRT